MKQTPRVIFGVGTDIRDSLMTCGVRNRVVHSLRLGVDNLQGVDKYVECEYPAHYPVPATTINRSPAAVNNTVIKKQRAAREKEREDHLHIQMACNHFLDMLNAQGVVENRNVFVSLDRLAEQRGYSTVNMIANMRFIKKE